MTEEHSSQKPTLAILGGTGKEGPGLAMRWAVAGYPILIGSRQQEKAQATAEELQQMLNLENIQGFENAEAARRADISILTVKFTAHEAAVSGLRAALQGKILVDATARVDFRNPEPPGPPAAAEYAQETLGANVRVVAAFQNVPAHVLRKNLDEPLGLDVLVCAEDQEAAQIVIQLAQDAGMRGYYAGGLANAIVVEGLTSILISLNKHYDTKTASIAVTGI